MFELSGSSQVLLMDELFISMCTTVFVQCARGRYLGRYLKITGVENGEILGDIAIEESWD